MSIIPNGALFDARPNKERDKDYNSREIAGGISRPFRNKKITQLTATKYSQEFTSSCVPHAFYTQLEYEKIVKPSPEGKSQLLAYRKRTNYPFEGSAAVDLYNQIISGQSPHFSATVRKGHTEKEANSLPLLAGQKELTLFEFFEITDYRNIARTVASGKAVVVFIYATLDEWSQEYVTIKEPGLNSWKAAVRHAVCLIPDGDFVENGVNWLSVHDSAAFGGRHLRYISAQFLEERAYYASQVYKKGTMPNPIPPTTPLPVIDCQFKDSSNAVKNLQGYLISKGFLESQYQTGYYGVLTAEALMEWQLTNYAEFNFIRPVRELLSMKGKFFGPQSIAIIKKQNV